VIVRMPPIPATADQEATYRGTLILGIGTADNNQPAKDIKVFQTENMGWVPMFIQGQRYYSKIDTGADFWSFPSGSSGFPHCADSGDLSLLLCPTTPSTVSVTVGSMKGNTSQEISIPIANAQAILNANPNRLLYTQVAYEYGGLASKVVLFGLPFFFGRDVYFGIDGAPTPIGQGPFYAF
jgi:hypothetical protein